MRHLVQGRSGIKPHLFRCQVQYACTVHGRIDKHRQSAENNDCRNGHRCFMRLAFHDRLGSQYGSSPTDRATGGCQQSEIFIHFQQTPDKQTYEYGSRHYNRIDQDGRKPDLGHALECQPETIQHDTGTQYLLRTKQNTGHPCLRQMVAQTVRIYHSQQDTDDQRTEG